MKTVAEIEELLQQQNLEQVCQFNTTEELEFFRKFTTTEGLRNKKQYIEMAKELKRFPLYYITYEDDVFHLNVSLFGKTDVLTLTESTKTGLKWILAFKNEYVLTYPSGMELGRIFKESLPIITKI